MTLNELYQHLKSRFGEAGLENPGLEARWLMRAATGLTEADFITEAAIELTEDNTETIRAMAARRLKGEPVSRILGERDFWQLPFTVTPDVLDPRPDSEILVAAALKALADQPPGRVLDLGTGSGCLIVALLYEWPNAEGVAVDVSDKALAVAKGNAMRNKVAERLICKLGSWYTPLAEDESFDLIVSNPPYIASDDIAGLESAVRNYDPILALDGGIDGFDSYKTILSGLKKRLKPDGQALFEIGFDQVDGIMRLVENHGFRVAALHKDPGGHDRVVQITHGDK